MEFNEIQAHAEALISESATRNTMYDDLEAMYLLDWKDIPVANGRWIKDTISPMPRNKLQGMVRILSATDPRFKIPYELNNVTAQKSSDLIEKMAASIWSAGSKTNRRSLHHDVVFSAGMYGEISIAVNLTEDIYTRVGTDQKTRAKNIMEYSPIIFRVLPPKQCYTEFDAFGLSAHLFRKRISVQMVRSFYGEDVKGLESLNRTDKVNLSEYWNDLWHAVWVEGMSEPITYAEHGLPFIPIATTIVEGSEFFNSDETTQTRQPLLYPVWKSNLWERQNLMLTAIYTNIYAVAANAQIVYKRSNDDRELIMDYTVPGGITTIGSNESLEPLAKIVIDPSLIKGLEIAGTTIEESTIYSQTLGEPLSTGNPSFSMTSLMTQAGKLPLVPYQRASSYVIADAVKKALWLLRDSGGKFSVFGTDGKAQFNAKDIPESFELTASINPDMPQDMRQNSAVAVQLVREGLVSRRYAMETQLNIENPGEMIKAIWAERYWEQKQAMDFEKEKMKLQQQMMAEAQTAQGQPPTEQIPMGSPARGQPLGGVLEQGQLPIDSTMMKGGGTNPGMPAMPLGEPQGMDMGLLEPTLEEGRHEQTRLR
jgi:hypothetical protein